MLSPARSVMRSRILLMISYAVLAAAGAARADTALFLSSQWADRGTTTPGHPLQGVSVSLFGGSTDASNTLLATGTFGSGGTVTLSTPTTDVDGSNVLHSYAVISASIPGVATAYDAAGAGGNIFTLQTPENYTLINTTSPAPFPISNINDASKMMQAVQLIGFINNYYKSAPFNATLPPIRINYNPANAGSSMGGGIMTLGYSDWGNIDVLFHEYGHDIAENNNLDYRPGSGEEHGFGQDQIGTLNGGGGFGPTAGSRLAWQEGIATYLGMTAIVDGGLSTAIPGLPPDDSSPTGFRYYDSYLPAPAATTINAGDLSFAVSINSRYLTTSTNTGNNGGSYTTFQLNGRGEGDEMSIMRCLNSFYSSAGVQTYSRNQDYANLGAAKVFSLMKAAGTAGDANVGTFYGFWRKLTPDVIANKGEVGLGAGDSNAKAVAYLGSTLEEYGISEIPLTSGTIDQTQAKFQWTEQNNNNSQFYKLLIYSSDWSTLVYDSGQLGDPTPTTLSNVNFTIPFGAISAGTYNYVVINDPAMALQADLNASNFNWYWSGPQTITIVPEPATLSLMALAGAGLLLRRRR